MAKAERISTLIRELMSRGRAATFTNPVRMAHVELVAALAGNAPHPIHAAVDEDLDSRVDHLEKVFGALHVYLIAIIADTAQNVPTGALDRHYLDNLIWRCVESGEPPRLFGAEPPRARVEVVRIVDMSSSNAWAEFSNVFRRTREAYLEHENAKRELKGLMPEDAKEAIGHGIRAKRSKSGAVSFDVLSVEVDRAQLQ